MHKNKKQISFQIAWLVILFWVILIFSLSAQPVRKSDKLSKKVTVNIIKMIEKVAPQVEMDLQRTNHLLRKKAHFFLYLVLGMLVLNIIRKSGVKGCKGIFISLLICIVYAISDEIHQLFVPGRGAQVMDVFIDSGGAFAGIILYQIIRFLFLSRRKKV